MLAGHRRVPPYGMAGGGEGQVGRNWVERADGSRSEQQGCDETVCNPGDVYVIQTPTGGAYGKKD